jgi:peptidoglycan/LPS O-acetylase OafA/YrhL
VIGQAPVPAVGHHGRSDIASRDRLPTLTGLRFWAALLVVLYHLDHAVGPIRYVDWLVAYGRTGVTFFFVLSGFVLAWNYLDTSTRFVVFIWRRFARLWPLVAVTGVLSLLAYRFVDVEIPRWQAATTFLFLQAWRAEWAVGANGAAWSLSDEAFFYALFPLILAVAASSRMRPLLWAGVVVAYPLVWYLFASQGWAGWRLDYLPLSRVLQFIVGVLCAVMMRRGRRAPLNYWLAVAGVVGFHLALQVWERAAHGALPGWGPYSGSEWWAMPFFALLIMAAAQRDLDGRPTLARGPISLRLGHWSYAWYLIHEVCVRVWLHEVPAPTGTVAIVLTWLFLLAITLLAAALLYTLVEHPSERFLRRLGPSPNPRRR